MAKKILVVFDAAASQTMIFAAHPTEANKKDYQPPRMPKDEATPLPIGTMTQNEDASWTIRLSSRPSGNTLVARPLA